MSYMAGVDKKMISQLKLMMLDLRERETMMTYYFQEQEQEQLPVATKLQLNCNICRSLYRRERLRISMSAILEKGRRAAVSIRDKTLS